MMTKHTHTIATTTTTALPPLQVRRRIRVYNYVLQRMDDICPTGVPHKLRRCKKTPMTNTHYFHFFTFPIFIKNPFNSPATWSVPLREHTWHVDCI
ncbi:hypothetical protein Hanom_Chr16g01420441 [Helianthus anomalus]